ncbi:MAG TPA: M15 family metallopeptidase [Puia sp.]|jgi:D-alanyl-D-alanine dipeptidase|nr:M15 family metallopeptidase [Puia sp.]
MRYNITQGLNILFITTTIFFADTYCCVAQNVQDSSLHAIKTLEEYQQTIKTDSNKQMINVEKLIPNIDLDLRYASENNFMHRIMYPEKPTFTFLRLPAAKALKQVQKELNKKGLGLKIFDAYRPYSVTEKFWELVHDDRYVADPKKGSGHNRGIAVDLTIINVKTKKELKMPTGFDNFTDSAHHDFVNFPDEVLNNRKLLKETMEKYGFVEFPTEWWHYSLPNPEKYEVLNLPFTELEKQ